LPGRGWRAPPHGFDFHNPADIRRSRLYRLDVVSAEAAGRQPGAADLAVPVLAATPRIQDVPVYLEGVGSVRALNNVLVRAQVDGN